MTELERKEVQAHGFCWEKELLLNVYKTTEEELKSISYTNKIDLPAKLNRLDNCDISIKTTGNKNTVCMGDCLRLFDSVSSGHPIHAVILHYSQIDKAHKKILSIVELNLTNAQELLFGSLKRSQIEELDRAVKSVPQKRKPTKEEHEKMYSIQKSLKGLSGAIYLNIKCDSKQSRLQCSFNKFQNFIENNPSLIIEKSNNHMFRGGLISEILKSATRVLKKK